MSIKVLPNGAKSRDEVLSSAVKGNTRLLKPVTVGNSISHLEVVKTPGITLNYVYTFTPWVVRRHNKVNYFKHLENAIKAIYKYATQHR